MILLLSYMGLALVLSVLLIFQRRNKQVYEFLHHVNLRCYEYNIFFVLENNQDAWERWYYKLPSYDSLLFSFKKLELKSFFSDNEINELLLKNINKKQYKKNT